MHAQLIRKYSPGFAQDAGAMMIIYQTLDF